MRVNSFYRLDAIRKIKSKPKLLNFCFKIYKSKFHLIMCKAYKKWHSLLEKDFVSKAVVVVSNDGEGLESKDVVESVKDSPISCKQ